jgi:hypothetical protein
MAAAWNAEVAQELVKDPFPAAGQGPPPRRLFFKTAGLLQRHYNALQNVTKEMALAVSIHVAHPPLMPERQRLGPAGLQVPPLRAHGHMHAAAGVGAERAAPHAEAAAALPPAVPAPAPPNMVAVRPEHVAFSVPFTASNLVPSEIVRPPRRKRKAPRKSCPYCHCKERTMLRCSDGSVVAFAAIHVRAIGGVITECQDHEAGTHGQAGLLCSRSRVECAVEVDPEEAAPAAAVPVAAPGPAVHGAPDQAAPEPAVVGAEPARPVPMDVAE